MDDQGHSGESTAYKSMGNQNPIYGLGANQASGNQEKQIPQNRPCGFKLIVAEFLKNLYPVKGLCRYDIVVCDIHPNSSIFFFTGSNL